MISPVDIETTGPNQGKMALIPEADPGNGSEIQFQGGHWNGPDNRRPWSELKVQELQCIAAKNLEINHVLIGLVI